MSCHRQQVDKGTAASFSCAKPARSASTRWNSPNTSAHRSPRLHWQLVTRELFWDARVDTHTCGDPTRTGYSCWQTVLVHVPHEHDTPVARCSSPCDVHLGCLLRLACFRTERSLHALLGYATAASARASETYFGTRCASRCERSSHEPFVKLTARLFCSLDCGGMGSPGGMEASLPEHEARDGDLHVRGR